MEEIFNRLNQPEYAQKFVQILFEKFEDKIKIIIKDQGKGFDWRKFLSLQAMTKNAFKTHGRGIFMARRLSFDDLTYEDDGSKAIITILLNDNSSELLTDFQES